MPYHENQHFKPSDEAEHEAVCEGRKYKGVDPWLLEDRCVHCNAPAEHHSNGRCPI